MVSGNRKLANIWVILYSMLKLQSIFPCFYFQHKHANYIQQFCVVKHFAEKIFIYLLLWR